jgi:hypothetical protein
MTAVQPSPPQSPSPPSGPSQTAPPQLTGQLSRGWILFILAVVFGSLTLWSLCAGFAYVALNGTPAGLGPAAGLGKLAVQPGAMDWWTSRVLSQVYTVALDQVASDPDVIELLGEPIEVDYSSEELFVRKGTGQLNAQTETIAFDIKGSQGSATVTVVATTPQQMMQIREIRVTTENGQTIEVTPPEPEQFTIR